MHRSNRFHRNLPVPQRGTALLIAMLVMLMLSIATLAAVRFSSLGVKMSANEELAVEAFQRAQSVTDATLDNPDNFRVIGGPGERFCPPGIAGCNTTYTLALTDNLYAAEIASGQVKVEVERLAPELGLPPRATGSSLSKFKAARFKVEGIFDGADDGLGRDEVDEGILILIPVI